jgi:hypothetical protein
MSPEQGAEAPGAPPEPTALDGGTDPDSPQMNQDVPPEQQENPYVSQQPLQFMGKGGRSKKKKRRQAEYVYRPPFMYVDVGIA